MIDRKRVAHLTKATREYHHNLHVALPYLATLGIDEATADRQQLGVVVDPQPGHAPYRNRLAIPYITPAGVVNIQFVCIQDHDCEEAGHDKVEYEEPKLNIYNVTALHTAADTIIIAPTVIDAIVLSAYRNVVAVTEWQGFYERIFEDFDTVTVPYKETSKHQSQWARRIGAALSNAELINLNTNIATAANNGSLEGVL